MHVLPTISSYTCFNYYFILSVPSSLDLFKLSVTCLSCSWKKLQSGFVSMYHDDVIKWKHFPRYWSFVKGIHPSPVNSRHKGQWRGALMLSMICVWINGWGWWFEMPSHPLWRHCDVVLSCSIKLCRPMNPVCTWYYLQCWWNRHDHGMDKLSNNSVIWFIDLCMGQNSQCELLS